ncbi:MAG: HAMP domain-containing sensor histidine kinase, partial [Candidatus Eremiobacterota bacterium]
MGDVGEGIQPELSFGSPEVEDLAQPEVLLAFRDRLRRLILVVAFSWTCFAILWTFRGYWRSVLVDLTALSGTLAIYAVVVRSHDPRRLTRLAQANLLWSLTALAVQAVLLGGSSAIAGWYMTAAPLLAAYQLGIRAAWRWGLFALGLIWVVFLSPRLVHVPPEFVAQDFDRAVGMSVLATVLLAFALNSRSVADRQVQALRQRERQIRAQAEAVAQARDQALAASNVKSQFVANMSHDLRSPLFTVTGMAELLAATPLEEDQRRMVEAVRKSGAVLMALVNDVLDFSRVESGAIRLDPSEFDVEAVADDVVELFALRAAEKGLELAVWIDPSTPALVRGDPARLQQVLLNLLANAVKFTDQGSVVLAVSPDRGGLKFEVRDTGPGVSPEHQPRLFEPFYQVEGAGRDGAGLGLAICERLVRAMGGTLALDSQPGEGSKFSVWLPLDCV